MEKLKKFLRGYVQTMLYGIEIKPKYKMDYTFYIIMHTINQFQLLAIIFQTSHDKRYSDFKLDITQSFLEFFLINNQLKSSMSLSLAYVIIIITFLSQLILFLFLCFSTIIRIFTANLIRNSNKGNLNSNIQNWVIQFNEMLHWIFVTYPVIYLQIAVLSFSTQSCNALSLITVGECKIEPLLQTLSIIQVLISFYNGQLLIYLMRNHRFNELNSLKRRYSSLLLFNNTIVLAVIFFHYNFQIVNYQSNSQLDGSDIIKYILANIFTINQIIDQLNNYPYRDPVRIPAISLTFMQFWIVVSLSIFRFTSLFNEQQLFFLIVLPLPIFYMIGQTLSQLFQYHALINANSNTQIKEKHLIITVDYFYKFIKQRYAQSMETQIKFQQFLLIHQWYCKNKKCYSQKAKFRNMDLDQKGDLHNITLSVIKCTFKTAQAWLFTLANSNQDLQFEQLQLQYISFISEIAQKPLQGYLELRKYQNNKSNNNSIYFIEITNKLADQLQIQILDDQQKKTSKEILIQEQKSQLIEISLAQQWQTQNLYESLLNEYVQLLDAKIDHWSNLMNGYPSLNPFQENTQALCEKISQLQDSLDKFIGVPEEWFDLKVTSSKGLQVKKLTHAQLNINGITLKLYSLFYSIMMNDYDRAYYIEEYVKDLTQNDRQKEIDIIDNLSLVNDQTTIILVSLVKGKGKIVNKNQLALANYFHYIDSNDFKDSVTTIHKLLPKAIMVAHELLIEQFLQRGHSQYFIKKINGYYENSKRFIEKSYIKLGNLFEEQDDYVITASILKCNSSDQTILIDNEGKIFGITEELYQIIKKINPLVTVEFFKEFCRVFLLFPQFLQLLKEQTELGKTEEYMVENQDFLLYIPHNLIELNSLFIKEQYERFGAEVEFGLESQNLSSWRSWKSIQKSIQSSQAKENHSYSLKADGNIDFCFKFMQTHKELFEQFTILRTKIKLSSQILKVKRYQYLYYTLEVDHIIEINSENKHFRKYPSILKVLEYQTSGNQMQSLYKTYADSHYDSLDRSQIKEQITTIDIKEIRNIRKRKSHENSKIIIDSSEQRKIMEEKIVNDYNDLSLTIQRDKGPQMYQTPLQRVYQEDEFDLLEIDTHFKQFNNEALQKTIQIQDSALNYEREKDESQYNIDENIEKHSSNVIQEATKNDLIQILMQNRQQNKDNKDQEEELKQIRSISSSRTSSSKSPCLLVRQLISLNSFHGNIRLIVGGIVAMILLFITLLFAKIIIVQCKYLLLLENYDVLQTNINYVTFPETMNFYFLKTTYFSWVQLQQQLNIVEYSDFIKKQMKSEVDSLKDEIDVKLNELYQGIIQYENQIISDKLKLVNVNENAITSQNLDLTQLLQLIKIHAFNFIENFESITSFKDVLFFRLNMPYIYSFAYSYITLLNENLMYYEDKIVNDVIQITMSILGVATVILIFITIQTQIVTQYERQILMLISRVSYKAAEEVIEKLLDIKSVLIEPSQLLWKKINFFDLYYESAENNSQQNKLVVAKSVKTTSVTRSNQQSNTKLKAKSKRSYQSNSLAQRIYDLTLINSQNYMFLVMTWLLYSLFVIGAILVTFSQVTDIKPTLDLNLSLIRFKFRFDSIVVYSEVTKTESIMQSYLNDQYGDLDMSVDSIIDLFCTQFNGFQESMQSIYQSLVSNSGLQETQKTELLMYFEQNLCNFMASEIPFCTVKISSDANFSVPQSFITLYGTPKSEDNNYEFISGGIINIVQEFSKTIQMYFSTELTQKKLATSTTQQTQSFLESKVHINQFIEYFLDTGKLLTTVGDNLFLQNQSKLSSATQITQIYVYVAGFGLLVIFISASFYWMKRIINRLKMMRMSLILIPYEILLEAKTMSTLKQL